MLSIGNKNFMNLQEAVGWLLENNALPFQSTANYAGNTEIAMSTLINPSPAKVRVGSIIFFADSKVSTVIGVTSNRFIVSDQYNDLVDDVVYVSNVAINASGHLICTLSNGDNIDAGLIKQVSNFSIDASQHLIANYNNGTSTDLGAIFTGNVNIAGNLTADSIIENMSGYSAVYSSLTYMTIENIYISMCKNGNKLTLVVACNVTRTDSCSTSPLCFFYVPASIFAKLYPSTVAWFASALSFQKVYAIDASAQAVQLDCVIEKGGPGTNSVKFTFLGTPLNSLTLNTKYYVRVEQTFLLNDSLV